MFFAPVVVRAARNQSPALTSFNPAFERFFNDATGGFKFEQDDKSWTLSLDIPGVSREELDIEIDGPVVRITTKTEAKRQYKAAYELAQEIDVDATRAELKDGVLTLALAKKAPVVTTRKITVQ